MVACLSICLFYCLNRKMYDLLNFYNPTLHYFFEGFGRNRLCTIFALSVKSFKSKFQSRRISLRFVIYASLAHFTLALILCFCLTRKVGSNDKTSTEIRNTLCALPSSIVLIQLSSTVYVSTLWRMKLKLQ